ncbi:hypothetical protein psyc5s11_36920 [Clostridium gelidum]|uniref:VCBS repeat-containing protein n=1 Tax=Clostridium gelidum TaxID=704125 RepID=A0ABN6IZU4_9CLOT|nr:hypothetical protein [Clostridium gelidum]BCZ47625.1 hypothetical protein psyc5s11_36920 [Clostridium gelidum]
MKMLILKKKTLVNITFSIGLLFSIITLIYFFSNKFKSIETISPINISQNNQFDLTGDSKKDILQILHSQDKIDFIVNCSHDNFYLSNQIDDKILFTPNNHLEPKIFLNDISRDNIPEIIIQGSKNNKSISYVFHWNKKNFDLIFSSTNNIFGILDCKNSRTPKCYSISSSEGFTSLNSFMLINDAPLDTSKDNLALPSLDSVIHFIDLIQIPYVLDDIPDIFTSSIDKENLSLLWNLDKDNYSYSFQNAFFYDYKWTDSGEPSSIRWRLSFEKNKLKGEENDKTELILLLDLEKDASSYKINVIQKIK